MDTFGPVSDNAQGVAEMSGEVSETGAQILTELDAVGNTTKAITKGIAIATAVLAATALFGSYSDAIGQALLAAGEVVGDFFVANVVSPDTLVGMLLGAAVVFLFSGLAVNAVSRAAGAVVMEVRKQFRDHPGIMDGSERPEYGRVVDICTRDSLRELATPGLLAVFAPIAVGFGLGVGPLAGYLAGTIATGTLMAVFLANSGGAWDNAKKIVEDGNYGGKGSPAHEATVIGDTVGDPFKDTAGPAINPLLKVMNLVSLLIAPAIVALTVGDTASDADPVRHRGRRGRGDRRVGDHQQAARALAARRGAAADLTARGRLTSTRPRQQARGHDSRRRDANAPFHDRSDGRDRSAGGAAGRRMRVQRGRAGSGRHDAVHEHVGVHGIATTESSEETTETTESSETTDHTETTTDDTETTTDVSAAELDDQSVYFFQTFCTGATALQEYAQPDTSGQTLPEVQATAIEGYTNLSNSAEDTLTQLNQLSPPTIENGQELYDNAVERFTVVREVYAAGAATIEALAAPTEEELRAAIAATEEEVTARLPAAVDLPDTAVQDAVRQIPECAPLF